MTSFQASEVDEMGAATVLVVDDEPFNVDLLTEELKDLDLRAVPATNGREALAHIEEHGCDLMLLDLMMPEMDGFEFLEALRTAQTWQTIPVVVITAKDLSADDRRRLNGGVERVVHKGTRGDAADLLTEVRDLVASRLAGTRGGESV